MIIITSKKAVRYTLNKDDVIELAVFDDFGDRVEVRSPALKPQTVVWILGFRFADDDGGNASHLCGTFCTEDRIHKELLDATLEEDLSPDVRKRFIHSITRE